MSVSIGGTTGITFNDASVQNTAATGFGFKNRIINGACVIDQRNAGASVTANSGVFGVDRWKCDMSASGKGTIQQTPSATETGYATRVGAGFTNYLAFTSSAATSLGATDYYTIIQPIEGLNISDFAWGTANAKTVTLSFWVYSSLTGTFGGALQNSAFNRSYPFSYSIPVANTWTQITLTVTGDTTGTWLTTNGVGIYVRFGLGVGATYSGTAGSWAGANYTSATGAVSVVGTNSATFYITGIQLEKGSTATSFDYRPIGTELALCQRYYFVSASSNSDGLSYTGNPISTFLSVAVGQGKFSVPMRTAPTVTFPDGAGQSGLQADTVCTASHINTNGFTRCVITTGSWTNSYTPVQGRFIASAEL